jgi:hypothetical protein
MKKLLIGAIVGGIILFLWQFLSFAALDLHRSAQQYTPKQDTLLSVLRANLKEGRYFMPTVPAGTSNEEEMKVRETMPGRDWAIIDYHAKYEDEMTINIIRSLLTNIVIVFLLGWILTRGGALPFRTIFLASVCAGVIAFFAFPYAYFIWYKSPGIWADFTDAIVPWALTGVWLGWYFNRK